MMYCAASRSVTNGFFDGHFIGFQPLVCADDTEATEMANRLVDGHDVELWTGSRCVIVLQHTSDEVCACSGMTAAPLILLEKN